MRRIQCGSGSVSDSWKRGLVLGFWALMGGLLGACQAGQQEDRAEAGLVEGFAGLVAADAPRAAVIGRDVLGNGGNAADAAVAMYFAMAVTLPSRASLGAGGVCLVFDNGDRSAEVIDFSPRLSGPGLVPLGVRGMAALHARQGLLRWGELISPAENLARFGHGVSRAFTRDLAQAGHIVAADPEMARILRSSAGALPAEGDRVVQPELAAVLGGIRAQGAAHVHAGAFANRFVEATAAAGLPVGPDDLRDAVPLYQEALGISLGFNIAYFSGPPANGFLAAQLWQILTEEADYADSSGGDRAHLFGEAAKRAFADRAAWLGRDEAAATLIEPDRLSRLLADYDEQRHTPADSLSPPPTSLFESDAGASLVVADRFGNAVACSVSMNGLFGSGRMAPGTGILLAAPPGPGSNGFLSPSAAIVGNPVTGDVRFAAAASGGSAAPTALVQVMLQTLEEEKKLEAAMRTARFHHGGVPDELFYESGTREEIVSDLLTRGHAVQEASGLGRVNALRCPGGVIEAPTSCAVLSDPRGFGLSTLVQ